MHKMLQKCKVVLRVAMEPVFLGPISSTENYRIRIPKGSLNLDSCESNTSDSSTENGQENKEVEQITFLENTMEFA